MKKKVFLILGATVLIIAVVALLAVTQSTKWSQQSFNAIVQEVVTQQDGQIRLIVKRTTKIYGSPLNSLCISEDTKLLDEEGRTISVGDFQQGSDIRVTLKEACTEETPLYYPIVYEIQLINAEK